MYSAIKYSSPLGELTIAAKNEKITALVIEGQKYGEHHIPGEIAVCAPGQETPALAGAREWLDAYFAGRRPDSAPLPLAPEGSAFCRKVWRRLMEIPYGDTVTYGAIARELGSSPRAVGGAVGHNPISILIPCHRVVGAGGRLTGYAGGIENKIKLLKLEGADVLP